MFFRIYSIEVTVEAQSLFLFGFSVYLTTESFFLSFVKDLCQADTLFQRCSASSKTEVCETFVSYNHTTVALTDSLPETGLCSRFSAPTLM